MWDQIDSILERLESDAIFLEDMKSRVSDVIKCKAVVGILHSTLHWLEAH